MLLAVNLSKNAKMIVENLICTFISSCCRWNNGKKTKPDLKSFLSDKENEFKNW